MPVRGDWDALRRLRETLRGDVKGQLLKAAAAEALTQVQLGFRRETDPDGQPWAPLKYRQGKILRDTGRLANSFTARPTDGGFAVGTNVGYAVYHQEGTAGRMAGASRLQPTSKRGRFLSKGKAAKQKTGAVALRRLTFAAGGGSIPARPMVPRGGQLSEPWARAIDKACDIAMRRIFRGSR